MSSWSVSDSVLQNPYEDAALWVGIPDFLVHCIISSRKP